VNAASAYTVPCSPDEVAGNMAFRPDGTFDPKVYVGPDRNWGGETAFRRHGHYVITGRLAPPGEFVFPSGLFAVGPMAVSLAPIRPKPPRRLALPVSCRGRC
jgi:hypothetical protein